MNKKYFLILFEDSTPQSSLILKKNPRHNNLLKDFGYEIDYFPQVNRNYDGILIRNYISNTQTLSVKKGNIFAIMQEPGHRLFHNFMYSNLKQFDWVYSPVKSNHNVKQTQPYLGWSIDSFKEISLSPPTKTKLLSCVMSNQRFLPLHRKRVKSINILKQKGIAFEHFGRGLNPIENKEDGLLDFYYSIAIENSAKEYYFTEKINDCFLCYTIPLYYGCTNIDKYFPPKSYIEIDINDIDKTIQIIKEQVNIENYQERLPYLKEAREILLKKYHGKFFFKEEILPILKKNQNQPFINHTITHTKDHLIIRILKVIKIIYKKYL